MDGEELRRIRGLLLRKYTWRFWLIDVLTMLARRGKRPHTGIVVTFG